MLFGGFEESKSKDFKETLDDDEFAEDYDYLSDSDLEDDMDECPSLRDTSSRIHSFDPFASPGESKIACEDYEECVEKGKVVTIPDIAFVT